MCDWPYSKYPALTSSTTQVDLIGFLTAALKLHGGQASAIVLTSSLIKISIFWHKIKPQHEYR